MILLTTWIPTHCYIHCYIYLNIFYVIELMYEAIFLLSALSVEEVYSELVFGIRVLQNAALLKKNL